MLVLFLFASVAIGSTPDNYVPATFSGDGSTTEFSFTWPVSTGSDVQVILRTVSTGDQETLVSATDYTVSATNNDYSSGGTITTTETYSSSYELMIRRSTTQSQVITFVDTGIIRTSAINEGYDKLTRISQEFQEQIDRCLKIPNTESATTLFASSIDRAGQNVTFDASGNLTTTSVLSTGTANISTFGKTLIDDANALAARATLDLGLTDDVEFADITATDITATDIITKGPLVDVRAYGAVGDASGTADASLTDNTIALTAAFAAAGDSHLIFEADKVYKVTTTLVVPDGCTVNLNGSKIIFIVDGAIKCLQLQNYTSLLNGTIENAGTNPTSGGNYQSPVSIGDYNSGVGYHNIIIDGIELESNRPTNGNLLFITSDSYNIKISNILVSATANPIAIINIHFGGYTVYDTTGSTHPHNITIDNVSCLGFTNASSYLIQLRGCYNVYISGVNATNCKAGFSILPGDAGKDYVANANEAEKIGTGLVFENCSLSDIEDNGVFINGLAGQGGTITSTTDLELPVVFRNCNFQGSGDKAGIKPYTCEGVIIDNCKISNFKYGVSMQPDVAQRVTIKNCDIFDNTHNGIAQSSTASTYIGNNHVITHNYIHGNNTDTNADSSPHKGANNAGVYVTGDYWKIENNVFGEASETQEYSIYINDNIQRTRLMNNTTIDVNSTAYYNGRDAVRQGMLTSGFNNTTLAGTLFGGTYIPETEIIAKTIPVMVTADATPTIQGTDVLRSLGTTTITDFDDGVEGQIITFIAETSITITDGTNIFLSSSTNWAMTATDTLTLICKADGKWYEVSRGNNGA